MRYKYPVEACGTLLNPEAPGSYKITYSFGVRTRMPSVLSIASDREETTPIISRIRHPSIGEYDHTVCRLRWSTLSPAIRHPDRIVTSTTVYGIASGGIHGKSDEECLDDFQNARFEFEYLFKNLTVSNEEAREFIKRVNAPPKTRNSR